MNSATLSLFSTGSTTGLVVEAGHALTSIVPIFEGYINKYTKIYNFKSNFSH